MIELVEAAPHTVVLLCAAAHVDLGTWARANRGHIDKLLSIYGAVRFTGFGVRGAAAFERVARELCGDLNGDYGDLPRVRVGKAIYNATPYPSDRPILFHNEASHTAAWPRRQAFCCIRQADTGGCTRLADGRRVARALAGDVRDMFARYGLLYHRTFVPNLDVSWQRFFGTSDRMEIQRRCTEEGTACAIQGDVVRLRRRAPALVHDPITGQDVWFNQIQLHHPRFLDPETRTALDELVPSLEDRPRHVTFGDGTKIDDRIADHVGAVLEQESVSVRLEEGDVLLVDNVLVAHARAPFTGERAVLVALGDMASAPNG